MRQGHWCSLRSTRLASAGDILRAPPGLDSHVPGPLAVREWDTCFELELEAKWLASFPALYGHPRAAREE